MSDKKYNIDTLWVMARVEDEYLPDSSLEPIADIVEKMIAIGSNKKDIVEIINTLVNMLPEEK